MKTGTQLQKDIMSVTVRDRTPGTPADETNSVRNIWGWVLAAGIVQILAGTLAVSFAFISTIVSVVTLGILLLVAAAGQTAAAILARDWGGFLLFLLLAVFYAVAGFLIIQHPLLAAEGLTLMLAAVYLVGGIFRIISACVERVPSRGWVLLNGVITLLLGILIWQQWPVSGLWVLGLFIGIDLIVNGVTWSALAICVRNRGTGR
ncbi:HdeD family acid-resistance protein [Fimbriiglobus ruber]|uniref:HdeD protein n=1 Tax=Fimbriiglobus ruber TaxID=1908690 RepID=A0A225DJE1_9BACT|nr:HdeD family acid-resistance protein [Fimbriiglobus ruber]OWK39824.1 HdeD protein [Fimbriiglobus ruber]